jgi:predicted DNA-binding protein (MmcQ/YjbR family)
MIATETVRKLAMAFEETQELPHFEVTSFRVKKKIFATMNVKERRACVKLPEIEQSVFCAFDKTVIYPVPNAWAKYGWTNINLKKVKMSMLKDALTVAYCSVAPARLALKYQTDL